jgi:muramoyltetrapeptide carboxypeptidase
MHGDQDPAPARRRFLATAATLPVAAGLALPATAQTAPQPAPPAAPRPPLLRAKRLQPGDTIALINPSNAVYERAPYAVAAESLQALGFKVREAPNLRARYGQFAGTDLQRATDVNAMFADPTVHGILALTGGSGANRILPLLDYGLIGRNPKFLGGFSDVTALINAVHAQTGLVTFHSPVGASEWNAFSVEHLRNAVVQALAMTLRNPREADDNIVSKLGRITTLRGGKAQGPLLGGNLAVLTSMAGSPYWPAFDGAILFLEDVNEFIYRVDRMLSTLKLAGVLQRLNGVVLGAFTKCEPGDGYGTLTLDEVFDDYFKPLNVPVYSGALIGHIKRKFTVPVGLPVEMDADAGTLRFLMPAVL